MIALGRHKFGVPWSASILVPAALLSDEIYWYATTHDVDTWNFDGGGPEIIWLMIWLTWQIAVGTWIVQRVLETDDIQFAAESERD